MGLAEYEPFRQEVTSKNFSIKVRGLSLDDCSILVRSRMSQLTVLADLARNAKDVFGTIGFFTEALIAAPDVLFDIVALAADEPSYSEEARKLPVGLQIKVLQAILELTLEDMGGPKALIALVQRVLESTKSLPQNTGAIKS